MSSRGATIMGASRGRVPDEFCKVLGDAIETRRGRDRRLGELVMYGQCIRYSHAPGYWPPAAAELVIATELARAFCQSVPKETIEAAIAARWER